MNFRSLIALFLALSLSQFVSNADDQLPVKLPTKENFHLFLLAGQSNMAGRGKVEESDRKVHPRVLALGKDGTWKPAMDPLHWDKPVAGVGLGKSFAIALAESDPDVVIGLIPAACGGSPIDSWEPGGFHGQTKSHPYDDAISRARRAMKDGVLKGILWHQGESDSKADRAPAYREKLAALIERFRKDLEAPDLPFMIGQLGFFPENPRDEWAEMVSRAHAEIAAESKTVALVSSEELTCKSDRIHFDATSLREFGKRYARGYLEMTGKEKSR